MTVIDLLNEAAKGFPDKTAFQDSDHAVTYSKLKDLTDRIASALAEMIKSNTSPVVVFIDRNIESICTMLGVAASRNFYIPVDGTQPASRVQVILDQMMPSAVVSIGGSMPEGVKLPDHAVQLAYEDLINHEIDRERLDRIRAEAKEDDPLFAICTSGSTGIPKGVIKSHRSVLSFVPAFAEIFGFDEHEVFGNQAPFDFDVSAKDIYTTIYTRATLYIIPRVCFSMPKLLINVFEEQKLTTIVWAVSALCIVAAVNAFKKQAPVTLKKILFSGEVMPIKMLNIWRSWLPDALFVNLYGPTEVMGNCTYYIVDREFDLTEKLPLGVPFPNVEVFYLNDRKEPIHEGEQGDIYVTGDSLAMGYYHNQEKTNEVFLQDFLGDGRMIYKTGDLAELRNGEYYFTARRDFQIKHMGHRIELEEIELHLNAVDGVTRASCLFDSVKNKIIAIYSGEADKAQIVNALKNDLPKYMIPTVYMRMETLPINKNGKIDRQRIKELYEKGE